MIVVLLALQFVQKSYKTTFGKYQLKDRNRMILEAKIVKFDVVYICQAFDLMFVSIALAQSILRTKKKTSFSTKTSTTQET